MRKLKLQMQVSIDGMVAAHTQTGPGYFNWDEEVKQYSIANAANVDCIFLGRKTTTSFIPYWKSVAGNQKDADRGSNTELTLQHDKLTNQAYRETISKGAWTTALDRLETLLTGLLRKSA